MCMMLGEFRQAYFSTLQLCAMARRRNIASSLLPPLISIYISFLIKRIKRGMIQQSEGVHGRPSDLLLNCYNSKPLFDIKDVLLLKRPFFIFFYEKLLLIYLSI